MKQFLALPVVTGTALVVFGLSAFAFAPSGGRVTSVTGAANILRDQGSLAVARGTVIQAGDVLSTPIDGRLQWWMEDDSLIAMASTSEVHVRRFEPSASEAVYTLRNGAMRIISGTTEPTILTPLAKVTALGTDFSTFLCSATSCTRLGPRATGNRRGKGQDAESTAAGAVHLYVRVDRGRVRVENTAGAVTASQGQVVLVESTAKAPDIIPEAPRILLEAALELEFEVADDGFVPGVPIQPLPPVELPGSPS